MTSSHNTVLMLQHEFGEVVHALPVFRDEISIQVKAEYIVKVCEKLKASGYTMLTDLSGVDNYGESPRFEVDYLLYSFEHRTRLRLKIHVPDDTLTVPSVTSVWQTANWHEREAFDMFGILFFNHPELTRILMWEGYPYHPLRKDFPLAGMPADLPVTAEDAGRAETAPMLGGPFVPGVGKNTTLSREPRQYDTLSEQFDKRLSPDKQEPV